MDIKHLLSNSQAEPFTPAISDTKTLTKDEAVIKVSKPAEFKIKISVTPSYLALLKEAKREEVEDDDMEIDSKQSEQRSQSSSSSLSPEVASSQQMLESLKKERSGPSDASFAKYSEQDRDMWNFEKLEKLKATNKLTFKQAGAYVLWVSGKFMNASEIVEEALRLKLIKTEGKTPNATMSSRINTDISEKGHKSIFCKFGAGKFSIKPKLVEHIEQELIKKEEKALGMTLLGGSALKYIPFDKEELWLTVKESTIPNSGLGLFATQAITSGTVFCEYRGRLRSIKNTTGDMELFPYAVSVQVADGQKMMIDGLDEQGNVLSLAPRANDAGPAFKTCIYVEYKEHPGKVFLEASRNINPGDEIFVCYGINYWNIPSYPIYTDVKLYAKLPYLAKELASKREASNALITSANQAIMNEDSMDEMDFKLDPLTYNCRPASEGSLKLIFRKVV